MKALRRIGLIDAAATQLGTRRRGARLRRTSSGVRLYVDNPAPRASVTSGEELSVIGWALSTHAPIASVRVGIDDAAGWHVKHGRPRAGVAAAFPTVASAQNAGFAGRVRLVGVAPGTHQLIVTATDTEGHVARLTQPLEVTESRPGSLDDLPPGLRDQPLIFLHIPKAAGTSVRETLDALIPLDRRAYVYRDAGISEEELAAMPLATRERLRFLMGHVYFGLHQYLPLRARYITMVRDPVERVISNYYHLKHTPSNPKHARVAEPGMDIERFLQDERLAPRNLMTRMIAGERPALAKRSDPYAGALANIEEWFADVLVVEEMDSSRQRLATILQVDLPPIPRKNVSKSPDRERVDPAVRRLIAELNPLDVALYEWIRTEFSRSSGRSPR